MSLATTPTENRLNPPPPLVPYPLDDTPRIVEMLCEVLQLPAAQVRRIMWQNEYDHGGIFREEFKQAGLEPYVWSDGLAQFYAESNCYLHGGVMWNRRPAKIRMRKWMGEYFAKEDRKLDIATVGDGPGIDSQYLANWGHRVTYSEISPQCMKFAKKFFTANSTDVKVVDGIQSVATGSQDAVVCLDVLEHLPDPHWMLKEIVRCLRPSGRFVVHAPFFFVTPANPTHLASNRRYSGDWRKLYGPHGLRPIDGHVFWDPLVLIKHDDKHPAPTSPFKVRLTLGVGGWLLAVGRWWNWPHNVVAHRAMFGRDDRWINELSDAAPSGRQKGVRYL